MSFLQFYGVVSLVLHGNGISGGTVRTYSGTEPAKTRQTSCTGNVSSLPSLTKKNFFFLLFF